MRAFWLASAALVAAPLSAQDHPAHGSDEQPAQMDHCAMGHLPPEQCPTPEGSDEEDMDHSTMDHGEMDHSEMDHGEIDHLSHGSMVDKSAPGAAPESAVPARALEGPRHAADAIWGEDAMAPSRAQLARENPWYFALWLIKPIHVSICCSAR